MTAGTKLIAGNKPVSFLTAQQLQQLQQQGQDTQVSHLPVLPWPSACPAALGPPTDPTRYPFLQVLIQTVPAADLQQGTAASSSKAVSTVVVTTAPSPKQAPEQQ